MEFEITTNHVPQNLKIQESMGIPVVCFVNPLKRKTVRRVKKDIDRCDRCFAYPSKYSKLAYPDSWYCSLCERKNTSPNSWVKRNGKLEFETNVYEIDDKIECPRKRVVLALVDEDTNESLMDDIKSTLIRTISKLQISDCHENSHFVLCSFSASGTLRLYDMTCQHTRTIPLEEVNLLKNAFKSRDCFYARRSEDSERLIRMLRTSNVFSHDNVKRPVLLALRRCLEVLFLDDHNEFCDKIHQFDKRVMCFLGGEMKCDERNGKMLNDLVKDRSDISVDVIALHDTYVKTTARRFVAPSLVSACRQSGGEFRVYDREDIVSSRFDSELCRILTSPVFSNCMIRLRASPDVLSVGRCFGLVRDPTKNREGIWRATRCTRDTSFAFELELVDRDTNKWWDLWSSEPPTFVTLQCAFMYEYVDDRSVFRRVRLSVVFV